MIYEVGCSCRNFLTFLEAQNEGLYPDRRKPRVYPWGSTGVTDNDWFAFLSQQPLPISIQGFFCKSQEITFPLSLV